MIKKATKRSQNFDPNIKRDTTKAAKGIPNLSPKLDRCVSNWIKWRRATLLDTNNRVCRTLNEMPNAYNSPNNIRKNDPPTLASAFNIRKNHFLS